MGARGSGGSAGDLAAITAAARDMGVNPGDPAYPFVQGIERMLSQFGAKIDAHEAALALMAAKIAGTAGRDIAESADRSARSMVAVHHEAAKRADRRWFWKAGAVSGAVLAGLAAVAGATGYSVGLGAGRVEAAARTTAAADIRAMLGDDLMGARQWRDLIRLNGSVIKQELARCEPQPQNNGRAACKVTLWTGPDPTLK